MTRIAEWLSLLALPFVFAIPETMAAEAETFEVRIEAGEHDRKNSPIRVPLAVPEILAEGASVRLKAPDGSSVSGQLTPPGLLNEAAEAGQGQVARELHFVLPSLKAGESATWQVSMEPGELRMPLTAVDPGGVELPDGFVWILHEEMSMLMANGRPVLEYVHPTLDESSAAARELTYKPFHHLYDPDGSRRVTKGPGGQYTHHRGIFYAFNRVRYGDGQQADVWHARGDAYQSHEETLSTEAGPVLGRHRVLIHWRGEQGKTFAIEQRELTAYKVPGGHLVEFASQLETAEGQVELDGDPQHAGFHFRADDEVASKTKGQTYFLRPDGPGAPGQTRNWEPKSRQGPVNLDWNALSFVLGDQRYTVGYLDHPDNPKEARYSERDYGRFGSYFEYQLDQDNPLKVQYRLWLQKDEMEVEEMEALDADFIVRVRAQIARP
ncbi:hypothetical protein BH23PLA1_BH23PLA1_03470 [soil metagenome]